MGGAVPKKDKRTKLKKSIIAAAIMAIPLVAQSAGLGKLTVVSALGQPLRAELDVSASEDELLSLAARVAPQEAFRQANIEYATAALTGLRFTLDKRASGQPYFRISSDRTINDPFIDILVELNWSAGRLVREYTFLLDPPELKTAVGETAQPATVNVPEVRKSLPVAEKPERSPEPASAPQTAARKEPARVVSAGKMAVSAEGRQVKAGDTLGKIAGETRPEGVSLDQMLVALFRGNPEAFDGQNMNRLKAGKILSLPPAESVAAVSPDDARRTILAHASDFEAYRKKLAGAAAAAPVAKNEESSQSSSGRIAPKVEDKAPAPAGKDKLQVSRTETGKGAGTPQATRHEEDLAARDKALKEANSRVAELEKNLADLKKLAEMKSQSAAALQQQAQAAKPPSSAPEGKKVEPPPAAKPEPASVVPPAAPGTPVASVTPPKPAEAPKPPPKPVSKQPLPPPEPSFVEENGPLVFGGGGLIALLAGYLGFRVWQRKRDAAKVGATSVMESSLYASSVFSPAESPVEAAPVVAGHRLRAGRGR